MCHRPTADTADAPDFLLLCKAIVTASGRIQIVTGEEPLLQYDTNAIAHWRKAP